MKLGLLGAVLAAVLAPCSLGQTTPAPVFSLPTVATDCSASTSTRAQAIAVASTKIHNEPRQKVLTSPDGSTEVFPLNTGPTYRFTPGQELFLGDLSKQAATLLQLDNPFSDSIRNETRDKLTALGAASGHRLTYDDYVSAYQALETDGLIPTPFCLNNSDEVFGSVRLGVRGHNMKLIMRDDAVYAAELAPVATDSMMNRVCDKSSLAFAYDRNHVFVTDFTNVAKYYDDQSTRDKFGVDVRGYFCFNAKRQLMMPLAIHIVDSGLTYTRYDSAGEWQFAKMALDAMELNYQQMRHLVEVHLVSIPIEVEMMRTMATSHPVYALLKHHFFGNFALELRGSQLLLELNTPYDKTLSYGARGSLRYLLDEFAHVNVSESVADELERRGLSHVLVNRLAKYGTKYYDILSDFTRNYTFTYYRSDSQVAQDCELQNWATNVQRVPELRGFPASFSTRGQLQRFLAQLIFQNAVKHHFMNGIVSWHSTAAPFSTPSLWNKKARGLPRTKGVDINPFDYAMPADVVPDLSYMASRFYRPLPREVTLLEVYKNTAIDSQPLVQAAILKLRADMADMETYVLAEEAKTPLPLDFFRPSKLPYFSYI